VVGNSEVYKANSFSSTIPATLTTALVLGKVSADPRIRWPRCTEAVQLVTDSIRTLLRPANHRAWLESLHITEPQTPNMALPVRKSPQHAGEVRSEKKTAAKVSPGTTSIKLADLKFPDLLRSLMEVFHERGENTGPSRSQLDDYRLAY
jgi:hypothetical protein